MATALLLVDSYIANRVVSALLTHKCWHQGMIVQRDSVLGVEMLSTVKTIFPPVC